MHRPVDLRPAAPRCARPPAACGRGLARSICSSRGRGWRWLVGLALLGLPGAGLAADWGPLELLGRQISPGEKTGFPYIERRDFAAAHLNTPVFAVRGARPGAGLCITAGIHGDELNGIEIAREVFSRADPGETSGTLILLPMINAHGIRSGERYMPDRRDLNRSFPGSLNGSVASIVARAVFSLVTGHCQALVDLHTGSFRRANEPQIRVGSGDPRARDLARHFGAGIVLIGDGPPGSLRREAADAGLIAVIYEAGEPLRFDPEEIAVGVRGVQNVMAHLGMIAGNPVPVPDSRVYAASRWERVPLGAGGFFFPAAGLGQRVRPGDLLGRVTDPLTDESTELRATLAGSVIGMAYAQPVLPGYALFHVGTRQE